MNPGDDRAVALARAEVWLRAVQEEDPDHVVPPTGIVTDLVDALRAGDRPVPPTRDLLADLDRFLDDRAPCDADLEAGTNGAQDWMILREFADDIAQLRHNEAERRRSALSGVPTEPEETT